MKNLERKNEESENGIGKSTVEFTSGYEGEGVANKGRKTKYKTRYSHLEEKTKFINTFSDDKVSVTLVNRNTSSKSITGKGYNGDNTNTKRLKLSKDEFNYVESILERSFKRDPIWGMKAPYERKSVLIIPKNSELENSANQKDILHIIEKEKHVKYNEYDPEQVDFIESRVTLNPNAARYGGGGKTYLSTYYVQDKIKTVKTPEGRLFVTDMNEVWHNDRKVVESITYQAPGLKDVIYNFNEENGQLENVSFGQRKYEYVYYESGDSEGLVEYIIGPRGENMDKVSFTYDDVGRVTSESFVDGTEHFYNYDENGNLTSITPHNNQEHNQFYDEMDLLIGYLPPGSEQNETLLKYNKYGELEYMKKPGGFELKYNYDEKTGKITSIAQSPDYVFGTDEPEFDIDSLLVNNYIEFEYYPKSGKLKHLTANHNEFSNNKIYLEHQAHLLTKQELQDENGVKIGAIEFSYYDHGLQLSNETVTDSRDVSYEADYIYDNDGLLKNAGNLTINREESSGKIIGTEFNESLLTTDEVYNDYGELDELTASYNGTIKYEYKVLERDEAGRIVKKEEKTERDSESKIRKYIYNKLGQLVKVYSLDPAGIEAEKLVSHYYYDNNGNRLNDDPENLDSEVETYDYDEQDRLLSHGDTVYEYTKNGELWKKTDNRGTTEYIYDVFGNLKKVSLPDGQGEVEYAVDGANRRVGRKYDGKLVVYLPR